MNTPLIMASGTFGYGFEVPRVEGFRFEDVGAIILKSVTLKPRQGNRPHRIAETPAGVLNSIGMQNPGVEYVVKNYFPMLKKMPAKFIANVGGESAEEYVEVAKIIDGSDVVVGIELNISCPNVKGRLRHRRRSAQRRGPGQGGQGRLRQARHRQTHARRHRHPDHGARLRRRGCRRALGGQHLHGHGHRHAHAPTGAGQQLRRPLRPGHPPADGLQRPQGPPGPRRQRRAHHRLRRK